MKAIISILLSVAVLICAESIKAQITDNYDSVLAKKLQADEYGMKSYVFIILKKGKFKHFRQTSA